MTDSTNSPLPGHGAIILPERIVQLDPRPLPRSEVRVAQVPQHPRFRRATPGRGGHRDAVPFAKGPCPRGWGAGRGEAAGHRGGRGGGEGGLAGGGRGGVEEGVSEREKEITIYGFLHL